MGLFRGFRFRSGDCLQRPASEIRLPRLLGPIAYAARRHSIWLAIVLPFGLAGCAATGSTSDIPFFSFALGAHPDEAESGFNRAVANASPSVLNARAAAPPPTTSSVSTTSVPVQTATMGPHDPARKHARVRGSAAKVKSSALKRDSVVTTTATASLASPAATVQNATPAPADTIESHSPFLSAVGRFFTAASGPHPNDTETETGLTGAATDASPTAQSANAAADNPTTSSIESTSAPVQTANQAPADTTGPIDSFLSGFRRPNPSPSMPNAPLVTAASGPDPVKADKRGRSAAVSPSELKRNKGSTNPTTASLASSAVPVQHANPAPADTVPAPVDTIEAHSPFFSAVGRLFAATSRSGPAEVEVDSGIAGAAANASPSALNANASTTSPTMPGPASPLEPVQNANMALVGATEKISSFFGDVWRSSSLRGVAEEFPIAVDAHAEVEPDRSAANFDPAHPPHGPPTGPAIDRKQVYPQIAHASTNMAMGLAAAKPIPTRSDRATSDATDTARGPGGLSLSQAVGAAVMSHPLMGAQAAKVTGSLADVRNAQGATLPQMQVYAGSGGSYFGSYLNYPSQFSSVSIPASARTDAGFTLKQLVYDFGAARSDIARSKSLVDAERLRLADQAEDIGLRTANAFLNLLEQEELITEINKVVADDNTFADLVKLSEKQGNGTVADVSRIRSKIIETEAIRTDIKTSHDIARDEFARLTKLDPARLGRPASVLAKVPAGLETAIEAAKQYNPSLLALNATGASLSHQLDSQKASALPRVDLQSDGLVKHYLGSAAASQGIVDSRVMLMLSYKLLDGGTISAQTDRIREDQKANDFRTLDERESIELNLRRFYQALSANRSKESSAQQGLAIAQKAHSLYLEQFKAGKRTVFEVLDSRMVVFTMQKNYLNAKYEQQRAAYGVLRNMGRLVETAIRF